MTYRNETHVAEEATEIVTKKGIGITNQRESAVVWDRESGEPLTDVISWHDTRTRDKGAQLVRSPSQSSRNNQDCRDDAGGTLRINNTAHARQADLVTSGGGNTLCQIPFTNLFICEPVCTGPVPLETEKKHIDVVDARNTKQTQKEVPREIDMGTSDDQYEALPFVNSMSKESQCMLLAFSEATEEAVSFTKAKTLTMIDTTVQKLRRSYQDCGPSFFVKHPEQAATETRPAAESPQSKGSDATGVDNARATATPLVVQGSAKQDGMIASEKDKSSSLVSSTTKVASNKKTAQQKKTVRRTKGLKNQK